MANPYFYFQMFNWAHGGLIVPPPVPLITTEISTPTPAEKREAKNRVKRHNHHTKEKHTAAYNASRIRRNAQKRENYRGSGTPRGRLPALPKVATKSVHRPKRVSLFRVSQRVVDGLVGASRLPGMTTRWRDISKTDRHLSHLPRESTGVAWLKDRVKNRNVADKRRALDGLDELEGDITCALRSVFRSMGVDAGNFVWHLSFLRTKAEVHQPPHVDYPWFSIDKFVPDPRAQTCTSCKKGTCCCSFECRFPYSVIVPLTTFGSRLEVWEEVDIPLNACDMPVPESCTIDIKQLFGFIFRGDVIHSGGFMSDKDSANLRAHLYVYPGRGGISHAGNQTNQYNSVFGWDLAELFSRTLNVSEV